MMKYLSANSAKGAQRDTVTRSGSKKSSNKKAASSASSASRGLHGGRRKGA